MKGGPATVTDVTLASQASRAGVQPDHVLPNMRVIGRLCPHWSPIVLAHESRGPATGIDYTSDSAAARACVQPDHVLPNKRVYVRLCPHWSQIVLSPERRPPSLY